LTSGRDKLGALAQEAQQAAHLEPTSPCNIFSFIKKNTVYLQ
jgi:hypothetical protein